MIIIQSIIQFIDQHLIVAVLVAWLIYRIGMWNERKNIIKAIEEELELHRGWVGGAHHNPIVQRDYLVFKLATNAIGNGIVRGPSLFLNKNLTRDLVRYRQSISVLNQLIDRCQDFQSNPELWVNPPTQFTNELIARELALINSIHSAGIGNETGSPAAYQNFHLLQGEIQKEKQTKLLPIIWLLTGINLYWLKELICRYF